MLPPGVRSGYDSDRDARGSRFGTEGKKEPWWSDHQLPLGPKWQPLCLFALWEGEKSYGAFFAGIEGWLLGVGGVVTEGKVGVSCSFLPLFFSFDSPVGIMIFPTDC